MGGCEGIEFFGAHLADTSIAVDFVESWRVNLT